MTEIETLIDLLQKKQPLSAMLAPSFPVVYEYPQIVGKLKRIGFAHVVEVTAGAKRTNEMVVAALLKDPTSRFITSPCPSFVRMIRTKRPDVVPFLALSVDSPMVATAKIVHENYPQDKPIFIGPCNAKKFEANEDHPELNILSLTYKEMDEVFKAFNMVDDPNDATAKFNIEYAATRLFPISGGLAQSSGVRAILAEDEVEVVSGWTNSAEAIERFLQGNRVRLLDILFCEGGCVHGPGVDSPLSLEERRQKVLNYWLSISAHI